MKMQNVYRKHVVAHCKRITPADYLVGLYFRNEKVSKIVRHETQILQI